ncbi:hypothetical protein HCC70_04360 [Streptococcus suis]|uniref:Uncharacterized protein n=1 Tax=Streptococcus suivaginalis TaxID=3028082 RepID=A0AA96VBS6_9STRE|nr:hypothetical protein [Streptococcus sp. 29896]MCK4027573.1 hypothetical protein [Streptococcus suis]WNY46286.1 hypothetical protein PXH68_05170 [Streptococcus sp. 29896]
MNFKDFINNTIMDFSTKEFQNVKKLLIGEYLQFNFLENNQIDKLIFSEKLYDYLEKLELKTKIPFQKHLVYYSIFLDKLVSNKIAKAPKGNKKVMDPPLIPRARRYYDKAKVAGKKQFHSVHQLIDYCRVMFCLYNSALQSDSKQLENFDLSIDALSIEQIILNMKQEQAKKLNFQVAEFFSMNGIYSSEVFYLIMTIIVYCKLMESKIQGD